MQDRLSKRRFTVVCGHETESVERVVEQQPLYCVVEKYNEPPEEAEQLHETGLNNT